MMLVKKITNSEKEEHRQSTECYIYFLRTTLYCLETLSLSLCELYISDTALYFIIM